jgi:riboflavin kinase / FMN adenylyltransferase
MQVFRNQPPHLRQAPCVLTIGNFDGVHLGHQAVLSRLRTVAQKLALPVTVMTFDPHPKEYFAHLRAQANATSDGTSDSTSNSTSNSTSVATAMLAPSRIQSLRDKACALERYGVDQLLVAHFNKRLSSMPAEDFIEKYLVQTLQVKHLFVGDDFQFGAARRGNFDMLLEKGKALGFEVERMPTVARDGQRISSSLVRKALGDADFTLVEQLLGRPYTMSGSVIHGRKLGRTLGFPTLNMLVPGSSITSGAKSLLHGVYAVRIHHLGDKPAQIFDGVASLGTRPAVEQNGRYLLETHVFDFAGDAYGKTLAIEFVAKLRDEANYTTLEALTQQIDKDAAQARLILAGYAANS